jgi:hypothetical protein
MKSHVLLMLLLTCPLACKPNAHGPFAEETSRLSFVVNEVNSDLATLGFTVDEKLFNLEVKNLDSMRALYNNISDRSQKDLRASLSAKNARANFRDGAKERLAFYDSNSKDLIFSENASEKISTGYIAHELAHVYQDQQWTSDKLWEAYKKKNNREIFNITNYMIEGYAELVREAYEQSQASSALDQVDLSMELGKVVSSSCLLCESEEPASNLPYILGLKFMLHQYKDGGWQKVEDSLLNLPSSSEQIIHPEKLGEDLPTSVSLPTWEDKELPMEKIYDGPMGEAYLLAKLLKLGQDERMAFQTASGWDGDCAQIYKNDKGEELFVWRILFDRVEDAVQLEEFLRQAGLSQKNLRMGRVLDWLITDNQELINRLRVFMTKNPLVPVTVMKDEISTKKQENLSLRESTQFYYPQFTGSIHIGPRK